MNSVIVFPLVLVGWIVSLCLHEFAHAVVAYRGGDVSVRGKGYLTLNPLRYVNVQYSIIMPLVFLLLGGIGLPGGAVYIEKHRLHSPKWASAVSLAGPTANALVALLLAMPFWVLPASLFDNAFGMALAFLAFLQVSAVFLNLLPIPGLDGFGIIAPFLPRETQRQIAQVGSMAAIVLFALFLVPAFNRFFFSGVYSVTQALGVPPELAYLGYHAFRFWG